MPRPFRSPARAGEGGGPRPSILEITPPGGHCGARWGAAAALGLAAMTSGCLGPRLLGEVEGTQVELQRAIRDGSKEVDCAPKETAIAEAHIKFAQDALRMGEYSRAKQHARVAWDQTDKARKRTDNRGCGRGDRDGDGIDDDADGCPDDPEDFDGFEDADGCPDKDNDGDKVLDASALVDGRWVNLDKQGDRDCRDEPEDFDGFEDEDGCPDPDNDGDGVLDAADQCIDVPEDVDGFEDADGCPDPDNDGDKLCDPWVATQGLQARHGAVCSGSDQCPDKAEDYDGDRDDDGCPDRKAEFDGCSVQITERVFFKFNKWDIDPRSFELLKDVATVMNEVPDNFHFRVEGHTDSKGSESYNKKLSQSRAERVVTYLKTQGIAASRLEAVGFGEERPIDSNRTAEGRARNRRVEFNISNAECKRAP